MKRIIIVIAYLNGGNESYSIKNEKGNESTGQDHALIDNNPYLWFLSMDIAPPNEVNVNVIMCIITWLMEIVDYDVEYANLCGSDACSHKNLFIDE